MVASLLLRGHVIDNGLTVTEDRIILILCICPEFGARKPRENRARADADEIQLQFTEPTLRGRADVNETLCEQIREPHADKRACQTKTCMKIRFRLTRLRRDKSIRFVLEVESSDCDSVLLVAERRCRV